MELEGLGAQARAKRERILESAQELFLERGFERTSMEAIREAAGVSKPTLYSYYSGKEALLGDCLRRLIGDSPQWFPVEVDEEALGSREGLRETFSRLAHRMSGVLSQPDYLALVRVIIAESTKFPQVGEIFRQTVPEQGLRFLSSVLDQAREQGAIEVSDPEMAARMFVGPLLTYVLTDGLLVSDHAPQGPSSERIEEMVDLYMKTISA